MSNNKEGQGIVTDDKGQEQPADKKRAQEPGHMPKQPVADRDKPKPLRKERDF